MGNRIKVWDILVRVFHWSLVLAFIVAYVSGEDESIVHIYSGYIILALISARVIWGVVGTKYARFSNFLHSKKVVIEYLKSLLGKNPIHYVGHNPAGGWMVMALLVSLFATTISGLQLYAVEEGEGPFAYIATDTELVSMISEGNERTITYVSESPKKAFEKDEDDEELWEEIHEFFANFTLLLIFIHIGGVFVSSKLHGENLVKAMIDGYKEGK